MLDQTGEAPNLYLGTSSGYGKVSGKYFTHTQILQEKLAEWSRIG